MIVGSDDDLYDKLRTEIGGIYDSVSELYTMPVLASNSLYSVIKRPAMCFFKVLDL